jgi:hypothetical protein
VGFFFYTNQSDGHIIVETGVKHQLNTNGLIMFITIQ